MSALTFVALRTISPCTVAKASVNEGSLESSIWIDLEAVVFQERAERRSRDLVGDEDLVVLVAHLTTSVRASRSSFSSSSVCSPMWPMRIEPGFILP